MSEIIVVGSAGFVGSNLCNYLVQHTSHNIASVDDLSATPDLHNLQPSINSKSRHSFYLAEADNAKISGKIFELEKPKTIIYNLSSFYMDQISKWKVSYENAIKTLKLWLDLSHLHGVKKFIIIGDPKGLYEKYTIEQQEFMSACEQAVSQYSNKFYTYLLKPCEIFGPRQRKTNVVAEIFINKLNNEDVPQKVLKKDFIYIKDFFFVLLGFLDNHNESGAYYIRGLEWASADDINMLADNILNEVPFNFNFGLPMFIDHTNEETIVHKSFSWVPHYKIIPALEHTLCWYQANTWAWR